MAKVRRRAISGANGVRASAPCTALMGMFIAAPL
jgi:hypothetical protein